MSITIQVPQPTPPASTGRIRGLQCRECGQVYGAEARHVCEMCFGPLEVAYDYEVIRAIISYFELYPEIYHHPQEDLVFAKLKIRDPAAAAKVGNLALEHQKGAERLRRVAQAVDSVLADREILRQNVDNIVRDFIEHERRHILMEDRDFFPAALKALEPQDRTEIASALTSPEDPLFSEAAEETFDALRARILQLEQEAEAERH